MMVIKTLTLSYDAAKEASRGDRLLSEVAFGLNVHVKPFTWQTIGAGGSKTHRHQAIAQAGLRFGPRMTLTWLTALEDVLSESPWTICVTDIAVSKGPKRTRNEDKRNDGT